jgi:hypothetical protein
MIFFTSTSVVEIKDSELLAHSKAGSLGRSAGRDDFFKKCLLNNSAFAFAEAITSLPSIIDGIPASILLPYKDLIRCQYCFDPIVGLQSFYFIFS